MIKAVIQLLATGILLTQIALVIGLILFVTEKMKLHKLFTQIRKFITPNSYIISFVYSLIAMLGSLFLSEIAHFQPCILCWYQRILMYPQSLLLYIAILRKEKVLNPYLLAMNIIGGVIALYHYLLQRWPQALIAPCTNGDVSCIKGYTFYYGYISIPLMAFTVFLLNIIILSLASKSKK